MIGKWLWFSYSLWQEAIRVRVTSVQYVFGRPYYYEGVTKDGEIITGYHNQFLKCKPVVYH